MERGERDYIHWLFRALLAMLVLFANSANATTLVSWLSPPNGREFPVGTEVMPNGIANGNGTAPGLGLDLALVLDSSGSMARLFEGKQLGVWLEEFGVTLVNKLRTPNTSVTVSSFGLPRGVLQPLTPLTPQENLDQILDAVIRVGATGFTVIGDGIDSATAELVGPNHTLGRSRQMIVFSDGNTFGVPRNNALAAIAAGVDAVHSVGFGPHSVYVMQSIVNGPDNMFQTADDIGVYNNGADVSQYLTDLINGTINLVGLDRVMLTMPNGTIIDDLLTDPLGNFKTPTFSLGLGDNIFTVTALGTDGSQASAALNMIGISSNNEEPIPPNKIPEPGTLALFGLGLAGLGFARRKRMI